MTQLSRRDFLKLLGAASVGALASERVLSLKAKDSNSPNFIIILWDAFSASHLSLYGYPRQTTPNIDKFASRSTVFHNHYSGGNFTTTGTATMLTGMLPWKHRAINYGGLVRQELSGNNPYTLLGADYFRFAFAQNPWPNRLMGQYYQEVDRLLPPTAYSLLEENPLMSLFKKDHALASIALEDYLFPPQGNGFNGSSLLGYLNKSVILNRTNVEKIAYRNGLPEIMDPGYYIPYLNETVYAGVQSELSALESKSKPYFAYFHLYSPHFPYRPRNDYLKLFRNDGYQPTPKPIHPLSVGLQNNYLNGQRELYDCQITQIDEEFGRLILQLQESGVLDNSYLIFTSDHGELFERGFAGHGFQFMYEPVLHIPLIIHAPGQTKREDVFAPTSNIDIVPTILSIAGKEISPDFDGKVLPGLGGEADEDRPIISIVAVDNSAFGPINKAVITMRKRQYKLIAYLGYEDRYNKSFELYDLEADPEELNDLSSNAEAVLSAMKDELFTYLNEANKPFEKN